jgi:hypothetical protein
MAESYQLFCFPDSNAVSQLLAVPHLAKNSDNKLSNLKI